MNYIRTWPLITLFCVSVICITLMCCRLYVYMIYSGEFNHHRAQVRRCQGQALEVSDETAESKMDAVGADPGSCLGRGCREEWEDYQRRAASSSGRESLGRVPSTGLWWLGEGVAKGGKQLFIISFTVLLATTRRKPIPKWLVLDLKVSMLKANLIRKKLLRCHIYFG